MKYSSRVLSLLALVSMVVFFAGCDKGDDNKKSKKDQQIAKLVGEWTFVEVQLDDTDFEGYDNFTLTITGDAGDDELGFTATGRPTGKGPWPGSGSLSFGSDVLTELIRNEGSEDLDIAYNVTDNSLTLTFNYQGDGFEGDGGRTENITGNWEFTLTK
jgi:hypothetical protein